MKQTKEKGITFSTPMIQAILDGNKSQTRRIIKTTFPVCDGRLLDSTHREDKKHIGKIRFSDGKHKNNNEYFKLYAEIGDILYVRETWNYLYDLDGNDQFVEGTGKYYYAADNPTLIPYNYFLREDGTFQDYPIWKSPMFMPRTAARIFLQITDVRVEKLQEISEDDAIAEGCKGVVYYDANGEPTCWKVEPTEQYAELWDNLNAKPKPVKVKKNGKKEVSHYESYPWNDIREEREYRGEKWYMHGNPFVWVIEYERITNYLLPVKNLYKS